MGLPTVVEFGQGIEMKAKYNIKTNLDVSMDHRKGRYEIILNEDEASVGKDGTEVQLEHELVHLLIEKNRAQAQELKLLDHRVILLELLPKPFQIAKAA